MAGFPNSADEAREHIQQIRSQKGLNGYETDVSDLENALQLLSDQLYQRPVHFLLELIQNADDNKYGDVLPTLSINYQDHRLEVSCNELGFSKKNVESLCRIGSSTKQGSTTTEHYTGEKGIGFKSVFKVADVVRVRSGYYSFKFDRSQKLGMIAPSWCEGSRPGVFSGTSFILEIPQDFDVQPVLKEIRTLDSRMLLFLRRLRRIDLTINGIGGGVWHNTISRRDELPSGSGILRSVTLKYGDQAHLYYVINYIAKGLPHDDQRPKARHADITLAFPVDEVHAEEVPSAQLVYSTLPVRDYGFKFSWLRYFPIRPPTKDCFQIFAEQGVQEVCRERILLAHSEDFVSPRYLLSVPLAFQDGQGNPLLVHDTLNVRCLSNQYTSTDWPVIRRLGVRKMRAQDFVEHLSALITAVPVHVSNQSTEWQSRLARGLIGILSTNPECKPAIFDLPIVRLRSGTWITGYEASRGEVILPVDEDLVLPPGIRFVEVDPTLCADEHWRHLFNLMGIVTVSAERVCDEISKMHVNPRLKPSELRKDDLLLQVGFMYRAGWSNPEKRDLWFATSNSTCRHGSQLYVDSNQPHSATRYLGSMKEQFPFIHPDYLDCGQDDIDKLSEWLVNNFHFSAIPRIISNVLGNYSFRVSAEFEFILASFPVSDVLLLLRSHWMEYRRWIAPDRSNEMHNDLWQRSRRNFLHKLSSLEVGCVDGDHAKISNTALPIPKFLEDRSFSIKFIDIPDPENEEWEFLRHLGVLVGSSTAMDLTGALAETHIQRLQALQGELEPSMNRIKSQYRQLHLLAGREREAIRSSFVTKPLIYVPPTLNCSLRGWFRLEDCRWSSIESLRKTPFLSNVYPELGEFFCTTLGLQDADQSCIAEEALKVTHLDGLKYISKLFIAFSQHMSMNENFIDNRARLKSRLLSRPIFPVLGTRESTPYMEFDQLQAAQEADVWFIADRVHLRNCFRGVVPILAIDTADIPRMKHLIRCLNLGNRLLSNIASGAIQTYSPVNCDQKATNIMRSKAPFIARPNVGKRLLPASAGQNTLINQLKSTVVYATDQITVEWSIKLPNGELMPGRADSGSAKIDASGRSLVIYITRDYAASGTCPIELVEIEEAFSRHGIPCGNAESDGDAEKPISKGYLFHATEPILSSDEGKALQSFLDDLEQARSIKNVTSRRWERNSAAQLKPFLSKICNLEKQDVSVFLPQSNIDQILGGSNRTNDKHEVAYFTSGLMSEEERHSRTSLFFPAVVAVPKQGKPKFRMQVPAMNAQDPELAFLGELQACLRPYRFKEDSMSSTFTIWDRTGAFTKLLTRNGYRGSTRWAADRTFYMEVITVNDGLEDSTFALHPHQLEIGILSITESLDMALRSIRGYDKPIYVWVDAICIDQDNEYEKVSQIRLMRDIFQSAKFVYGWLGPEEDDSSIAIDTLLQIRMQAYKDREWPVDLPSIPLYWAGHKIPPPNSTVWEAIDALFGRDWFERVWIMQEIILAPDVIMVCGRCTARWQYLFEALEICLREAQVWVERSEIQPDAILQTTAPAVALGQTRKLYSDGPVRRKHKLLTLFELFAHTKATLELDKMFGLLGLATDAENDDLNPDYSSLETVVRRYAGVFVAQGNVIDLLHQAGGTKAYEFSSWIPAWTRGRQFRTISTWNSRLGYFRASGDSSAYAFVSGKILTINGTIVDSVSAVNDVTLKDSDVWTFVNSMYTFLDAMVSYPTGETMEQVKLMLPIGNACHPYLEKASDIKLQTDAGDGSEDFEWAQTLSKFSSIQALLDFLRQPAPVRVNLWKYWRTVSAFSLRLSLAKFFITANGYVGLAPADITVGDAVVIFQGGLVPFVVKPGAGSGGRSRLVGECYVHGLMHGEASQLPDAKEDMIFLE
ncbi:putative Heterokaryon incompatibility domain-containing protein [Seiridium unicorne]|uniref:Heterokaryon incompatibility domain-containing protein n=1 Tax=Seiridium unicorne TaxID=138068 RepID=A0ABR2VGE9_9PEZI